MLTLKADTAKMLREIPAEAQAAVGASETRAVVSASTEAAMHTRIRALAGAKPRATNRNESPPPARPPTTANTGGIHAYQAASARLRRCTSTRYSVVQLVHSE